MFTLLKLVLVGVGGLVLGVLGLLFGKRAFLAIKNRVKKEATPA